MHWPLVYLPDERLSSAELSAARLDGDLVEIGEGYMPADAIESVAMRAASLRSVCAGRLVACSWSAAWVYGALDQPPARQTVAHRAGHRVGNRIDRRAIFHDVGIDDEDIADVVGVLVTSPLRTLIDVARRIREPDARDRAVAAVGVLIADGRVDPHEALRRLDARRRLPGSKEARRELLRHVEAAPRTA